ncbi:hypothetical protein ACX0HA_00295 [Flavobacterium hauense]
MKTLIAALLFSIYSFGQNPACGRTITNDEMAVLNRENVKQYEYKDSDFDMLADLTTEVMGLYNDNYVFEVFFFMKDKKRIGITIAGSFNDEIRDRISCYLLVTKMKGLPDKRFLLFQDVTSEKVVYKITNEK